MAHSAAEGRGVLGAVALNHKGTKTRRRRKKTTEAQRHREGKNYCAGEARAGDPMPIELGIEAALGPSVPLCLCGPLPFVPQWFKATAPYTTLRSKIGSFLSTRSQPKRVRSMLR
jgi:hypothetical protein